MLCERLIVVNVQAHAESTIGAWQVCLEMLGIVACLTNLLLVVLVSENVSMYVPKSMSDHLGTFEGKVRKACFDAVFLTCVSYLYHICIIFV